MLGAGRRGTCSSQNHQLRAPTYSPLLFCSCLLCHRNSARVRICEFAYSLKFCCDLLVSFKIVSHLDSFGHFLLPLAMHLNMFICKAKNDPLTAHLLCLGLMLSTLYLWEFSSFRKTPLLWPHWRTALGSQLPSWPSGEKIYLPLTCICGKLIALPNIYFPASASFILSSTLTSVLSQPMIPTLVAHFHIPAEVLGLVRFFLFSYPNYVFDLSFSTIGCVDRMFFLIFVSPESLLCQSTPATSKRMPEMIRAGRRQN